MTARIRSVFLSTAALSSAAESLMFPAGVSRLEELPELPDISSGDGVKKLEDAIEKLNTVGNNQIRMEELK